MGDRTTVIIMAVAFLAPVALIVADILYQCWRDRRIKRIMPCCWRQLSDGDFMTVHGRVTGKHAIRDAKCPVCTRPIKLFFAFDEEGDE